MSIPCGISLYYTYFCRVLVCRADVWDIYECIRVQLLVSYAYEPDDLRRFHRITVVNMLLGAFNPIQALMT